MRPRENKHHVLFTKYGHPGSFPKFCGQADGFPPCRCRLYRIHSSAAAWRVRVAEAMRLAASTVYLHAVYQNSGGRRFFV